MNAARAGRGVAGLAARRSGVLDVLIPMHKRIFRHVFSNTEPSETNPQLQLLSSCLLATGACCTSPCCIQPFDLETGVALAALQKPSCEYGVYLLPSRRKVSASTI